MLKLKELNDYLLTVKERVAGLDGFRFVASEAGWKQGMSNLQGVQLLIIYPMISIAGNADSLRYAHNIIIMVLARCSVQDNDEATEFARYDTTLEVLNGFISTVVDDCSNDVRFASRFNFNNQNVEPINNFAGWDGWALEIGL